MKRHLLIASLVAGLIAAGCGGGGSGSSSSSLPTAPGPQATAQTGQSTMSLFVPDPPAASASSRNPEYISSGTHSISLQTTLMPAPTVVALTLGSGNCPAVTGGYNCEASFTSPVGPGQTLTVKTYANTVGTGTPLSQNTMAITISAGENNGVNLTLNAVATGLSLSLTPNSVSANATPGFSEGIAVFANLVDASGATIIGSGTPTDVNGNVLAAPTLSSNDPTDFSIGSLSPGAPATGTYTGQVNYDGASFTSPVTFTLILGSFPNATATVTLVAATPSPSPSPSPTASPTASPSPTPSATPTAAPTANAIVNGDFETGDLTGWYYCRAGHAALSAPINPSPAVEPSPNPATAQAATVDDPPAFGTPIPSPVPVIATVGAVGYTAPHGGTYAAQIGNVQTGTGQYREKGFVGICQDVAVPSSGPGLSLWVWEGGNVGWFGVADTEADIFVGATWATGATTLAPTSALLPGKVTTATPTATLFAETNCYNNANTSGGTSTSDYVDCAMGTVIVPPNTHGGQWREKGPYDLSAYANETVTIMIGVWSSSSSTGYYDYLYADDVVLSSGTTGTVPIIIDEGAKR